MGKKEKEHRRKVTKRNEAIKVQQKRLKKAQENFIMEMIEREKAAGKFDNNTQVPIPGVSGPIINGPQI
jgi:hypothetical protein